MANYRQYAEELVGLLLQYEEAHRMVFNNITELAHGELGLLRYLMEQEDGANAKTLSQHLKINTSRVAAILNSLEKKGYVERRPDEHDGRMVRVYLREEGAAYAEARRNEIIELCAGTLAYLGEEDTENWMHIVRRLPERAEEVLKQL